MADTELTGDSLDRLLADPDNYFRDARRRAEDDLRRESRGQVVHSWSSTRVITHSNATIRGRFS